MYFSSPLNMGINQSVLAGSTSLLASAYYYYYYYYYYMLLLGAL